MKRYSFVIPAKERQSARTRGNLEIDLCVEKCSGRRPLFIENVALDRERERSPGGSAGSDYGKCRAHSRRPGSAFQQILSSPPNRQKAGDSGERVGRGGRRLPIPGSLVRHSAKDTQTQDARANEIDTPIALTQLSNIALGST